VKRLPTSIILLLLTFGLMSTAMADKDEISGYVAIEGRTFFNEAAYPGQEWGDASVAGKLEYYHEWDDVLSLTFTPFARLDSTDPERTHFDIRELNYLYVTDKCELRIGVAKVFWGVTEAQHLVDIINQTDFVEAQDGEEKLGQPMVHLSVSRDWGVLDMFVLPYFRERTFPGKKGRLRTSLVVDDEVDYESSLKEYHPDLSIRYSRTIGNWDIGISHFWGTGREPTLIEGVNSGGVTVWIPHYEIIHQTGLDLQLVTDAWLWKLECIYRSEQDPENFFALTGGFEYTFTKQMITGNADIGVLCEWLYDTRDKETTTGYDNDIMFGLRLGLNDAASTEALIGVVQDLNSEDLFFSFESSRRIGERWKISLEALVVFKSSEEDAINPLRDDDYIQLELSYHF